MEEEKEHAMEKVPLVRQHQPCVVARGRSTGSGLEVRDLLTVPMAAAVAVVAEEYRAVKHPVEAEEEMTSRLLRFVTAHVKLELRLSLSCSLFKDHSSL